MTHPASGPGNSNAANQPPSGIEQYNEQELCQHMNTCYETSMETDSIAEMDDNLSAIELLLEVLERKYPRSRDFLTYQTKKIELNDLIDVLDSLTESIEKVEQQGTGQLRDTIEKIQHCQQVFTHVSEADDQAPFHPVLSALKARVNLLPTQIKVRAGFRQIKDAVKAEFVRTKTKEGKVSDDIYGGTIKAMEALAFVEKNDPHDERLPFYKTVVTALEAGNNFKEGVGILQSVAGKQANENEDILKKLVRGAEAKFERAQRALLRVACFSYAMEDSAEGKQMDVLLKQLPWLPTLPGRIATARRRCAILLGTAQPKLPPQIVGHAHGVKKIPEKTTSLPLKPLVVPFDILRAQAIAGEEINKANRAFDVQRFDRSENILKNVTTMMEKAAGQFLSKNRALLLTIHKSLVAITHAIILINNVSKNLRVRDKSELRKTLVRAEILLEEGNAHFVSKETANFHERLHEHIEALREKIDGLGKAKKP